jgi:hypothetical protein
MMASMSFSGLGVTVVAELHVGLSRRQKVRKFTLFHHDCLFGEPWQCC